MGNLLFITFIILQNPGTICGAIHYCQSDSQSVIPHLLLKSVIEEHRIDFGVGDECSDCTAFFGNVQDLFANYTVQVSMDHAGNDVEGQGWPGIFE